MTISSLLDILKNDSWLIVVFAVAIILLITQIRQTRADNQASKNKKVADDIEDEKKKIKEKTDESEKTSDDIKSQVKKNESILEKYKKWKKH